MPCLGLPPSRQLLLAKDELPTPALGPSAEPRGALRCLLHTTCESPIRFLQILKPGNFLVRPAAPVADTHPSQAMLTLPRQGRGFSGLMTQGRDGMTRSFQFPQRLALEEVDCAASTRTRNLELTEVGRPASLAAGLWTYCLSPSCTGAPPVPSQAPTVPQTRSSWNRLSEP